MEWVLLGLAGCGVAAWGGKRLRDRMAGRREHAAALATLVKLCEEDVTLLGEQLRRLDAETAEHPLDEAGRIEYQAALDAYESAQRAVPKVTDPEDILALTDTLNDGRYALACVLARVAGQPVPEKRTPCFFNPQHGPSVKDVMFTARAAGGTRRVSACAQDAARIEAGERPEVRTIEVGGHLIAYRDAFSASVVIDAKYHQAAIDAGAYGGFPRWEGGGGG
jgi:hypothetical protein